MERFGFVGLPNAGKSSLFNALVGGGALAAPYAFATTDLNIGTVHVPDERLTQLARMSSSINTIPTTVEFVDIGGLVEGASRGEGLGNRFLAGIREVDAIVFVLRAFKDLEVPGPNNPLDHLRTLEIELALADMSTVEKQISKLERAMKGNSSLEFTYKALKQALAHLSDGIPLYRSKLELEDHQVLKDFSLLTDKPVLAVVNIDEDQLVDPKRILDPVVSELDGMEVLAMCVQLEAEAALLGEDERSEILMELGIGEGALPRFIRSAYRLLGLCSFFTTGEKESRAWTFRMGSTAPECAGRIHTDFEKGFIRAETIAWDELIEIGSWLEARNVGRVRSEGKEYRPNDGDVMEFRFNV